MTDEDLDRWFKENEHYLQAALTWLRLRLERLPEHSAATLQTPAESHLFEHKSHIDRVITDTEVDHTARENGRGHVGRATASSGDVRPAIGTFPFRARCAIALRSDGIGYTYCPPLRSCPG